MKPEFTADGISVQTFDEVYEELADGYRAIYGTDINLDPDSPDGQRVGIEATARLDLQSFALSLYNQFDPDFAAGQALNRLIKFSGITRRTATRSQVDVDVEAITTGTLLEGFTVKDTLGQNWVTLSEQSLTAGTNTVTLFAENFGAVEADAETITEPVTITTFVSTVSNPLAATVGTGEETDEELRVRRSRSVQNPATSTVGGIFTAVGNLTNVTDIAVYENDTDTYDAIQDIDANTIWIVVEGGEVSAIAEAIAKNKTGGTGLKGDVETTYTETLIRPNGDEFTIVHPVKFDRPIDSPILLRITVQARETGPAYNLDAIEDALMAKTFNIGEALVASELYPIAYEASPNVYLSDFEVSRDSPVFYAPQIEAEAGEKFYIDSIIVTTIV